MSHSLSNKRFTLAICELFYPVIHGYDNLSDPEVLGHYLVYMSLDLITYKKKHICKGTIRHVSYFYNLLPPVLHPWIRNYHAIVKRKNYIQLHIVETMILEGGEKVAIIKTFWLRLVQRAWKRVFSERKCVLQKRCLPEALVHWQRVGKWPLSCFYLPSLQGMLTH